MKKNHAAVLMALLLSTPTATLATPALIRIGDLDGFGFGDAAGLLGADGQNAKRTDGDVLGIGDLLPDLNGDGVLAARYGDDFDNRLDERVTCAAPSCIVHEATAGADYTDIALSMTYDYYNGEHIKSVGEPKVYNHNLKAFGKGGKFPSATPSSEGKNQPGFVFDFTVDKGAVDPNKKVFFNLVFADYDVAPASVRIKKKAKAGNNSLRVRTQKNGDGEVQLASLELLFEEVFSENANGTAWDGYLEVDFSAALEPYTAFDYVELSPRGIPIPATFFLMLIGLAGLAYRGPKVH
jgi:hypothetical protein